MPIRTARRIRPRVPYSYYRSARKSMCSYGRFTEPGLPARCKTIHYRMPSDLAARVAHYGALWWSRVPALFSLLHPRALWLGGPAARSQNERSVGGLEKRKEPRWWRWVIDGWGKNYLLRERLRTIAPTNRDRLLRYWFFLRWMQWVNKINFRHLSKFNSSYVK